MNETGIMGYGVVGKAVDYTISKKFDTFCYDKYLDIGNIEDLLNTKVVFICVPTPFDYKLQKVNLNHVNDCLEILDSMNYSGVAIIKSTMPLNSVDVIQDKYNKIQIVYNPEFLRESTTPNEDFLNQQEVVIGTKSSDIFTYLKNYFSEFLIPEANYYHVSFKEAEMIKLSQNTTLASRVAIANIIYDFCQSLDVDYSRVREIAFDSFSIIGPDMVLVPGPDGERGFGGKCLPKDSYAFNSYLPNKVLKEMLRYNQTLRNDLDKFIENYEKD